MKTCRGCTSVHRPAAAVMPRLDLSIGNTAGMHCARHALYTGIGGDWWVPYNAQLTFFSGFCGVTLVLSCAETRRVTPA